VLTEVKAYSAWRSAPTLPLGAGDLAETDLIQVRNIEGLDPVKAGVSTSPYGSIDGDSVTGTSVPSRNIVLTLHPNPDWKVWTPEALRRLIYSYFMPKLSTRLVFYSNDMPPVEIYGVVEDVSANSFSKDLEYTVSIICPDPYFTALDPVILTGLSNDPPIDIDYNGNIEAGIHVKLTKTPDPPPSDIGVQIGDPQITYFAVLATVDATLYFEMSSLNFAKYVQNVDLSTGVITNLLSKVHIQEGSLWPLLQPGVNEFSVITDIGKHDWELTYFERFGGL
jgi:hypothetical protein